MWRVMEALAYDLVERDGLDLSECYIDGSFCTANSRASILP